MSKKAEPLVDAPVDDASDDEADVNDAKPEPDPVGPVPNVILEHQQIAGEKHWPVYVETFHPGDRRPPTLIVNGVGYCASRVDPESGLWIYRSM